MRGVDMTVARRFVYAGLSAVLPAVLFVRITSVLLRKRRNLREFLLALPVIGLFVIAWACGEGVGYIAGPGDSLSRVE